jgi:chromosomal replication initiator protein
VRYSGRAPFDPYAAWRQLQSEFALQHHPGTFDNWIQDTWVIAYEDGEFVIGLTNPFHYEWMNTRLRPQIKRRLAVIVGRSSIDVRFSVQPRPAQETAAPAPLYDTAPRALPRSPDEVQQPTVRLAPPRQSAAQSPTLRAELSASSAPISVKHTFESFVVGKHNALASAAAEAVTKMPGQQFNPLFIYGGVGLGKTHLLHAIANRLLAAGCRVLYCSAEQFTNELIEAIRHQRTELFREKYRQVDALLIDDIQFIAGKESTQEEFFHTFNQLHVANRQVVISSDRPPRDLVTLDARLRSRFEGGVQTDIVAPDFETRVAILLSQAQRQGLNISQEVIMYVAERVSSNVRELEGALNNLRMQALLYAADIDIALAERALSTLTPHRTPCSPGRTLELTAAHFGLTVADFTGRRRTAEIALARQVAMYLLRAENGLSLPAIGTMLGGRDHSTVSHGVEKIAHDAEHDELLRQDLVALRTKIYN